jgi:uncharacterized membrane protein YeaQ/YmgE (transglycosylase-associated protein family)
MPWLGWIILGLMAGYIASKNKDASGIALDIALGLVGALLGGYVFAHLGLQSVSVFAICSMVVAVFGAVLVLIVYHTIAGGRATR